VGDESDAIAAIHEWFDFVVTASTHAFEHRRQRLVNGLLSAPTIRQLEAAGLP
jgi:hypothetical protein